MVAASFTLRRYTPADEAAAIELWRRTWQLAYPHINFDDRVVWWRQRWREELVPAATITVAEANGKMLGFVTVDPCTFDIDQTVVAPEAKGKGNLAALAHEDDRVRRVVHYPHLIQDDGLHTRRIQNHPAGRRTETSKE